MISISKIEKLRKGHRYIYIYIFVAEVGNVGNVTKAPIESPFRARQPVSTSIAIGLVAPGSNFPKYKVFPPNFLNIREFSHVSWVFPVFFPYIFHLCPMFRGIFSHLFPSPTPPLVIPAQLPRLILSGDAFTHHRHGIKASEEDEITPQVAQPVLEPNFGGKMLKLWENPSKLHFFFSGRGYAGMGISAMWS